MSMQKDLDNYLVLALKRLEEKYQEALKTQTYNQETENLKLLIELTREQVKNENSSSSTR